MLSSLHVLNGREHIYVPLFNILGQIIITLTPSAGEHKPLGTKDIGKTYNIHRIAENSLFFWCLFTITCHINRIYWTMGT